jgi:hypothetical protein
MKILTELEAPLFAFKVLMDWALDASQSGYNFIPQQESYQSQMQTIAKWVGMEHMRPSVVNVPLPGIRPDDAIPVTTFDFISQLHSLLSDKELNTPANLVINQDAPFTRYTPPDGRLGECLSGSWYNHAWDHMETNTNCTFMIPIIMYIDKTQMSLSGKQNPPDANHGPGVPWDLLPMKIIISQLPNVTKTYQMSKMNVSTHSWL